MLNYTKRLHLSILHPDLTVLILPSRNLLHFSIYYHRLWFSRNDTYFAIVDGILLNWKFQWEISRDTEFIYLIIFLRNFLRKFDCYNSISVRNNELKLFGFIFSVVVFESMSTRIIIFSLLYFYYLSFNTVKLRLKIW